MMTTEKRIGDYVKAEIDFWRDIAEALETANAELREALRYQLAVGSGCTCDPSLPVSEGTCPYHKAHALLAGHDSSMSDDKGGPCAHSWTYHKITNKQTLPYPLLETKCELCGGVSTWVGRSFVNRKMAEAFHDSSSSGAGLPQTVLSAEQEQSLFLFLKHGSSEHADWLGRAIREWSAGREKPEYVS